MKQIIRKELSFNAHPVRVIIEEGVRIWVCIWDLSRILKRPQYLIDKPIFTMCPRSQKLVFSKDKNALWAATPTEAIDYFYSLRNENQLIHKTYNELAKWLREITPEFILEASGAEEPASCGLDPDAVPAIFEYDGKKVSFLHGKEVEINATEMAKAFNKSASHWLRNASSQEFINELSGLRNRNPSDLVRVINGDGGGTWMHEDVAIEFARWLSPKFAIWCNDRIKELMKHGITATQDTIEDIISNPDSGIRILEALKKEREEKAIAIHQRDAARYVASIQKPKVDYYDNVVTNREVYSTHQISAELGMDYRKVRKMLFENKVITSILGELIPAPEYVEMGEFQPLTARNPKQVFRWNKEGRKLIFETIAPEKPY